MFRNIHLINSLEIFNQREREKQSESTHSVFHTPELKSNLKNSKVLRSTPQLTPNQLPKLGSSMKVSDFMAQSQKLNASKPQSSTLHLPRSRMEEFQDQRLTQTMRSINSQLAPKKEFTKRKTTLRFYGPTYVPMCEE